MFKSIGNFFNGVFGWFTTFLAGSATKSITFICIIIGAFVSFIAIKLIIECLNGTMHKSLKWVICLTIVIVLIVGGYFGITYAVNLANKISKALS